MIVGYLLYNNVNWGLGLLFVNGNALGRPFGVFLHERHRKRVVLHLDLLGVNGRNGTIRGQSVVRNRGGLLSVCG